MMEISPLPLKTAYATEMEVQSPTPVASPDDDDVMGESPVPPRQTVLEPPKTILAE